MAAIIDIIDIIFSEAVWSFNSEKKCMHKLATHFKKLKFKHSCACVMQKTRVIASFEKLGGTTQFLKTLRGFGCMLPWKNFGK